MHISVLLQDVLDAFSPLKIKTFIDGTLGAGGHAEALLKAHPEMMHYYGIDQDPEARRIAAARLKPFEKKLHVVASNFSALPDTGPCEGILLDLGVSSMQLDQAEKGFSFMREGPLDMRMNPEGTLTAADIVNTWSEHEIGRIYREYGEEKKWRKAAWETVKKRPYPTTADLAQALDPVLRVRGHKGIHPLTLVFQALRIAVNEELTHLEKGLPLLIDRLQPGGRLAIISFHSLEDRIVKNYFRFAASDKMETSGLAGLFRDKEPTVDLITRKPIEAREEEVQGNPRSRSAKLRVIQKR